MKCSCIKGQCAVNCKYKKQSLWCAELCKCGGDEDICKNSEIEDDETCQWDSEDEL